MNRKSLTASLVASSMLASSALAQTPKGPSPAPAPAAPAAAPVPVTPEMRAAVKDLLETTRTREGLAQTLQQMSQSVRPQMGQMMAQRIEMNSALTPEQKQQVRASMEQPFEAAVGDGTKIVTDPKVVDDAVERMTSLYAQRFTLDEVKQLTAFYKSPIGQKSISAVPSIVHDAMQGSMTVLVPKLNALADSTVQKQVDAVTKGGGAATTKAPAKK
jgi:hypothetical protein